MRPQLGQVERVFARHELLLSPTLHFTAPTVADWDAFCRRTDRSHGNYMATYAADTHLFNIYGYPAISVPYGAVNGLPVGLQIIGKPDREALLLRAASTFLKDDPVARPAGLTTDREPTDGGRSRATPANWQPRRFA
ncbi:amidase family protein [Streptomyces phaeochromogenes]|uniref:amidase family protein n=1 Tax=Streptomyces phaeochromogenes TaxID=1923 RepID=UPI002DD91B6E|nr:amidase family protein [Streptomyces phaeochromogenes]WRZ36527.1 amidase family protein [Streptomyces phaeochromogenes]